MLIYVVSEYIKYLVHIKLYSKMGCTKIYVSYYLANMTSIAADQQAAEIFEAAKLPPG